MLSYQHAYHAGNFADVLKHLVLVNTLMYVVQKPGNLLYLDTHAGDGSYRLDDPRQTKTGEAQQGAIMLNNTMVRGLSIPAGQALQNYLEFIQPFLLKNQYPGSPAIAAKLLRENDRIELYEMHPTSHLRLSEFCGNDRRIHIHNLDGFLSPEILLPPIGKRAVVLIDPAYEDKQDYQRISTCLTTIWKRMPSAIVLLWYPVVFRHYVTELLLRLSRSPLKDVWQCELTLGPDDDRHGMTGSGMILLNPPWELPARLKELLPVISQSLSGTQGNGYVRCLLPE